MRGAFGLLTAGLILFAAPAYAEDDNTCMDCAQRTEWRLGMKTTEAMCCMGLHRFSAR